MSTTTNISLFFLLFSPIFLQLHARESQFFNKFSNHIPIEDELIPTTTINEPQQQQDEDQNFIPQSTDSTGYGLYGRHLPPSTTTISGGGGGGSAADDYNHPTTTLSGGGGGGAEDYNHPTTTTTSLTKNYDTDFAAYSSSKNQFNGDGNMYRHLPPLTTTLAASNGAYNNYLPTTTLPENYNPVAYTTPIHSENSYETTTTEYDNKDQMYNGDSRMYNSQKQGMDDTRVLDYGKYNHVNNMYNSEKHGMSDTRYMDNGKYYYDLNSESSNPRVFVSRNGYNTRGYYGNDDNSYNNRYNSNARFQENQEDVFTP